jgi:hypothetical protein
MLEAAFNQNENKAHRYASHTPKWFSVVCAESCPHADNASKSAIG